MCPTDVQVTAGDEHHEQNEKGLGEGGLETMNGETDSQNCAAVPDSGVPAKASAAMSSGEHDQILSEMRDVCERQDCSTKEISDATLLRFLKAKSMVVAKAATMFVEHQKWRASKVPLGYVPESECARELACNKMFLQGRSKAGWAVGIKLVRNHNATTRDLEETKRLMTHFLDKAIASAAPEAQKVMMIVDLKNIAYKNLDAQSFIAGFGLIQNYYPERLAKVLMINSPFLFTGTWKVINRFLDADIRSKVVFVSSDKVTEACLSDIDMDVLPSVYGGNAKMTLLQDAVVPNWPPVQTT